MATNNMTRIGLLFVVVAVVVCGCVSDLARARYLIEAGEPEEAAEVLDKIIEEKPDNVDALYLRGRCTTLGEAIVYYDRALLLDPSFADAYLKRSQERYNEGARVLIISDDWPLELLDDVDACLRYQPENIEALMWRAEIFSRAGDEERLRADLMRVTTIVERNSGAGTASAEMYLSSGDARLILGEADLAIGDYGRSIQLDGSVPDAYVGRAQAYRSVGKAALAEADLEMARGLGWRPYW